MFRDDGNDLQVDLVEADINAMLERLLELD